MNSYVIKFVAGGGKTTRSEQILKEKNNGLYLAYTNSVVDSLKKKGYLCRTIDSLFIGYIIPKFTAVVPIVGTGSKIKFVEDTNELPNQLKGIANIKICRDGSLLNHSSKLDFNINLPNYELHNMRKQSNLASLRYIFGRDFLRLTNSLINGFAEYLLQKYPDKIVELLRNRFSYIIIDEAQDLCAYRETFAKLLYESNIELYILGDDNQNLMHGEGWFETLAADVFQKESYRCPDGNCKWIRENLGIEIYGNSDDSTFQKINMDQVSKYDNGSRWLLYSQRKGSIVSIIDSWKGPKKTIASAKGRTINEDIVIIGESLNKKNYYTAVTRTKKNVYSIIKKIKL